MLKSFKFSEFGSRQELFNYSIIKKLATEKFKIQGDFDLFAEIPIGSVLANDDYLREKMDNHNGNTNLDLLLYVKPILK